jgi:hypothetical protein
MEIPIIPPGTSDNYLTNEIFCSLIANIYRYIKNQAIEKGKKFLRLLSMITVREIE